MVPLVDDVAMVSLAPLAAADDGTRTASPAAAPRTSTAPPHQGARGERARRTLSFSNASLTGRSDRTTAEVGDDGGAGAGDGLDSAIAARDDAYPVNTWLSPQGGVGSLLAQMKRESGGRVGEGQWRWLMEGICSSQKKLEVLGLGG
jgi:hypothetical protein